MRELTAHVVKANEPVKVTALDPRGHGGASHDYLFEAGPYRREINFQNGFSGINGITNEAVLAVLIDRMEGFQSGPFPCEENEAALGHLRKALEELLARMVTRIDQGVEGKDIPHESSAPDFLAAGDKPVDIQPAGSAPPFKPTKKQVKKVARRATRKK